MIADQSTLNPIRGHSVGVFSLSFCKLDCEDMGIRFPAQTFAQR